MNWNEMDVFDYNREVASRLRGLAAMVESCDVKVKIKIGAKLRWTESGDSFQSPILPFNDFIDRFTSYTTDRIIDILKNGGAEADPIREKLEGLLKRD